MTHKKLHTLSVADIALIKEARTLAEKDLLDEAVGLLQGVWRGPLEYPAVPDDALLKAEVLFTVGDLSGRIGSTKQIPGIQEHAKDLLSEAVALFDSLHADSTEAQVQLAVAYWRCGSLPESGVILDAVLERATSPATEAKALLFRSVLRTDEGRPQDALDTLNAAGPLFDHLSETLKGKFHNQRARVLKALGELDRARIEYEAARFHFEQDRNYRYVGSVASNLGALYLVTGSWSEALHNLDIAITVARRLGVSVDVARANETKARVLLASGRQHEAKQAIEVAVGIFRQGDEHSVLAEALVTQGRVYARLNLDSRSRFQEALQYAETGDELGIANAALAFTEEIDLGYVELVEMYRRARHSLRGSQRQDMQDRLHQCAAKVANYLPKSFDDLETVYLVHEARLVDSALMEANGSLRSAAKKIGLPHSNLAYHIKRNPFSNAKRNPAPKKSIIK